MKESGNLFALLDANGGWPTREQWLRKFFGSQQDFTHSNTKFVFMPEFEIVGERASNLLFGWIARETEQLERTAPSDGLELIKHRAWQAAFIAIDPTEHPDGQKFAFENLQAIGKPEAVLRSIVKTMNIEENSPYYGEAYPIVEGGTFSKFALDHGDLIKSITFDVAAPNMFNDRNDFQDELRSLKKNENVSHVKTTLESDTALNHQTDRMKDIIDYTERGAGTLSARAADGETYHSDRHAKHVDVKVDHHSKGLAEFLAQIASLLDKIFE